MIIELKKEQREEKYNMIGQIFSTTCNIKILGLSMRMVPMMNNDLPSHTKMKVAHLMAKQEQYISTLRVKSCVYLQEIDYFDTDLKKKKLMTTSPNSYPIYTMCMVMRFFYC